MLYTCFCDCWIGAVLIFEVSPLICVKQSRCPEPTYTLSNSDSNLLDGHDIITVTLLTCHDLTFLIAAFFWQMDRVARTCGDLSGINTAESAAKRVTW